MDFVSILIYLRVVLLREISLCIELIAEESEIASAVVGHEFIEQGDLFWAIGGGINRCEVFVFRRSGGDRDAFPICAEAAVVKIRKTPRRNSHTASYSPPNPRWQIKSHGARPRTNWRILIELLAERKRF